MCVVVVFIELLIVASILPCATKAWTYETSTTSKTDYCGVATGTMGQRINVHDVDIVNCCRGAEEEESAMHKSGYESIQTFVSAYQSSFKAHRRPVTKVT